MITDRSAYVLVEEIDLDRRTVSSIRTGVTSVLLETWCAHELEWVVSEPNAPPLWTQVIGRLRGYLGSLWMSGALQGETPGEAFFVRCDQATMTPEDILNGHVICLVGVALVTPGELTLYRIHIRQKSW